MITVTAFAAQQIQFSSAHDASVNVERADVVIHESHRVLSSDAMLNVVAGARARSGFANVSHSASNRI